MNFATHERFAIVHEPPVAKSAGDEHAAAGDGVFTKNIASCDFFLADIRRLVLTRPSGPSERV